MTCNVLNIRLKYNQEYMAKDLVGLENDGLKTKVIFIENDTWYSEDLKVGITLLKDLLPDNK